MLSATVRTERRTQLVDITALMNERLAGSAGSAVVIFVPHTTAGVILQASGPGATAVAADVESALERLVDEEREWRHAEEGDRNPWAHVRAVLAGSSLTIPLADGHLALGSFQSVFLCEFDGPRERTVQLIPL
jgi:secondary thiamine-phosphate synthase enzyme